MSNSLNPDQAGHFVGPDFDPNCLQKTSADKLVGKTLNIHVHTFLVLENLKLNQQETKQ